MLDDTPLGLTAELRGGGHAVTVADPVRVRRLSDREGQQLLRITRRGTGSPIRLRRAMVVLASAGGNTVPAIARLVQADEDTIRQVIHRFNEMGLAVWTLSGRVAVPAESLRMMSGSSSRRPRPASRRWTRRSPGGAYAS